MISTVKYNRIDWPLLCTYLILVIIGWLNIYSALYSEEHKSIFDLSQRYGMQFVWIISAFILGTVIIFFINPKIYSVLSPAFYIITCVLLLAVIFLGETINGSNSWFVLGPISFQPAEISKISTSLFLAYVMSRHGFKLSKIRDAVATALIILIPMAFIILEKETGSALVYAGLVFMLYREGLSGWFLLFGFILIMLFITTLSFSPLTSIIIASAIVTLLNGIFSNKVWLHILISAPILTFLGFLPKIFSTDLMSFAADIYHSLNVEYWAILLLSPPCLFLIIYGAKKRWRHTKYFVSCLLIAFAFIVSVDFIFDNILQPHQRARIENLLGIEEDLHGSGYNVHQSRIAIGSGGLFGKGFLEGTQTKFNFVPEQGTDFIFCTIGEEHGFAGSLVIIILYGFLITRLIILSEKQKDSFIRIYGYCVACCFFMHFFINIGMTMGLVPVIGIPLPFLSYGGSSLWSFTTMLFIFLRLDLERWN